MQKQLPSGNSVLIVAGEASSALYALRLLQAWKKQGREVQAFGIGSQAMEKAGFEVLGRSEDLAVVGLQEVIRHFAQIKNVFFSLLAEARQRKPRFALLLDYPDFNLRLAKRLKKQGIPIVYYISPQVWAWRQSRVHLIKRLVSKILVLFPFEADFYQKYQVPVQFVGHPLVDEISPKLFDQEERRRHRARFGLSEGDIVLALMPGSRRSEINHHLRVQLETAKIMQKENPRIRPVLLVAPTLDKDQLRPWLADAEISMPLIREEPFAMISLADIVLCASGTATLMVGLMEKPMVVMYRMNPITAFFAKLLVRSTPFFGMVNLIMGREIAPELFQEQANPVRLAQELGSLLEPRRYDQICADLRELRERLGGARCATDQVAAALEPFWLDGPSAGST